jgi:hypothetical protein
VTPRIVFYVDVVTTFPQALLRHHLKGQLSNFWSSQEQWSMHQKNYNGSQRKLDAPNLHCLPGWKDKCSWAEHFSSLTVKSIILFSSECFQCQSILQLYYLSYVK